MSKQSLDDDDIVRAFDKITLLARLENQRILKSALVMLLTSSMLATGVLIGLTPLVLSAVAFSLISFTLGVFYNHFRGTTLAEGLSEGTEFAEVPEQLTHELHHISEHPSKYFHISIPVGATPVLSACVMAFSTVVGALSLTLTVFLMKKVYDENKSICHDMDKLQKEISDFGNDGEVMLFKLQNTLSLMQEKLHAKRFIGLLAIASSLSLLVFSSASAVGMASLVTGATLSIPLVTNPVFLGVFIISLTALFIVKSYAEHRLNLTEEAIAKRELEIKHYKEVKNEYGFVITKPCAKPMRVEETLGETQKVQISKEIAVDEGLRSSDDNSDDEIETDDSGYDADDELDEVFEDDTDDFADEESEDDSDDDSSRIGPSRRKR